MELSLISINALICIILVLFILGLIESRLHKISLNKIPVRIHVNGTRGKSSVTRLISAGLRAGGIRTFAKTTGTAPRIIDSEGKDRIIHRLRSASIGEQIKLMHLFSKEKPDAIVMECMAVQPEYQWISEHQMIQSHIGVITNARPDHLEEMGPTIDDVKKIFLHQANEKLDEAVLKYFYKLYDRPIPENIMPISVDVLGNTSVATIPTLYDIVLKENFKGHQLNRGDIIIFASVGAGMNVNAITYQL